MPPLRGWTLLAVAGAIAVVVLLVPVQGLVIARWVAGLNANFSIPLTVILAVIVWERVFERSLLAEREWTTAWSFGAIGGLALYPMALGLGSFDPYEWGWPFSPLFVVIGALTVLLDLETEPLRIPVGARGCSVSAPPARIDQLLGLLCLTRSTPLSRSSGWRVGS